MFDYEVVIIGGGPAGLAAGMYLGRANRRALLLEKEEFGGPIKNVDWIENYPGYAAGVSGALLASEMVTQATRYGLRLKQAEATAIELFSSCRCVTCADGTAYTCAVVIIAAGARHRRLGVPGEEALYGKGIFSCALCDGGRFADRVVAVCGGGDAGITEALYMTRIASRVILIEMETDLTGCVILKERAHANPKLEIRCGVKVEAILGHDRVEGIAYAEAANGQRRTLKVDGILIYVGLEPNTGPFRDVVAVDDQAQILVDGRMESATPYILAAGDIRSQSPRQIVTAVGDGTTAAISAQKLLEGLE